MSASAIAAFDAIAEVFDRRFGAWESVAAQRRCVRRALLRAFPVGSRVLELAGGTGEDALFLGARGRRVVLTDGAPAMVARARRKIGTAGLDAAVRAETASCESMETRVDALLADGPPFDGAYSNFAGLNCVEDLSNLGRALVRLVRPGGHVLLVLFGPCALGEIAIQLLRGEPRAAFRRFRSGPVPARIGARAFTVRYPTPRRVGGELGSRFRLRAIRGIGIFVPPSAAEPVASRLPRMIRVLEACDRLLARPLALLADHVLLDFEHLPAREGVSR